MRTKSLSHRTFIDKRARNINERRRIGDVEADFVVSGKSGRGILLVVVDRKIRASFLEQIVRVTVQNVHAAFVRIRDRFPEMKTLTMDNDILFQKHEDLARLLGARRPAGARHLSADPRLRRRGAQVDAHRIGGRPAIRAQEDRRESPRGADAPDAAFPAA